jgi:hypothetical protein
MGASVSHMHVSRERADLLAVEIATIAMKSSICSQIALRWKTSPISNGRPRRQTAKNQLLAQIDLHYYEMVCSAREQEARSENAPSRSPLEGITHDIPQSNSFGFIDC